MNVLVVDVGNTSTSLALARSGRIQRVARLPGGLRDCAMIERALRRAAGGVRLEGAILSSVVPALNGLWLRGLQRATGVKPLLMSHRLSLGFALQYPRPATLGTDRLADAAGAVARYGAPVIVADFGTALTFNLVNGRGAFIGGSIAPGLPLMTAYLADRTAKLPRIRLTGRWPRLGRSTRGAMRLGAEVGYRGLVRELTAAMRAQPGMGRATLCATGGYAARVLRGTRLGYRIDPNLTLFGLSRIATLNRDAGW